MEHCGFFDARLEGGEYDRVYTADQHAQYFASFIGNGVFKYNPVLGVVESTTPGLSVTLTPGQAWINGYWYKNDEDLELPIALPDESQPRIDAVAIRWNSITRDIKAVVLQGEPNSSPIAPTPVRDMVNYDLILAHIRVNAYALRIEDANITDTRLDFDICGFVYTLIDRGEEASLEFKVNQLVQESVNFIDGAERLKGKKGQILVCDNNGRVKWDDRYGAKIIVTYDDSIIGKIFYCNMTSGGTLSFQKLATESKQVEFVVPLGTFEIYSSIAEKDTQRVYSQVVNDYTDYRIEYEYLTVVSWANGSWEEIGAMLESASQGKLDTNAYWTDGDVKYVQLPEIDATDIGLEVQPATNARFMLKKDYVNATQKKEGWYIVVLDLPTSGMLHNGTSTTFEGTLRYKWLQEKFYPILPEELKPLLKEFATILYTTGGKDYFTNLTKVSLCGKTSTISKSGVGSYNLLSLSMGRDNFPAWLSYWRYNYNNYWYRMYIDSDESGGQYLNTGYNNPGSKFKIIPIMYLGKENE